MVILKLNFKKFLLGILFAGVSLQATAGLFSWLNFSNISFFVWWQKWD